MALHPGIVFLGGLVVIIVGAEMLLRGATRIAALLRLTRATTARALIALTPGLIRLAVR